MPVFHHVRTHVVRGLLIVLPTIITLWLLRIFFVVVSRNVTPLVLHGLSAMGVTWIEDWHATYLVPVIGLVLMVVTIYVIGLFAANITGQRVLMWAEAGILKIPLVKSIYGGSRQILDAFGSGGSGSFNRVVLVEYPRLGVWTVGFVTSGVRAEMPFGGGTVSSVPVFFPTTPNPTSGWLAMIPERDILEVDLTIEEGVKLIVSGGIVTPASLSARIKRPGDSRPDSVPR